VVFQQPIPGDYRLDDLRRDLQKLERGALPPTHPLKPLESDRSPQSLREVKRLIGILDAMTSDERARPMETIDDRRCRRIAVGAGVPPSQVKQVLRQFQGLQKVMKAARKLSGR